eukprot:scaffold31_cov263-Pinguiococcus_pyrenoidosus.AAC.37
MAGESPDGGAGVADAIAAAHAPASEPAAAADDGAANVRDAHVPADGHANGCAASSQSAVPWDATAGAEGERRVRRLRGGDDGVGAAAAGIGGCHRGPAADGRGVSGRIPAAAACSTNTDALTAKHRAAHDGAATHNATHGGAASGGKASGHGSDGKQR